MAAHFATPTQTVPLPECNLVAYRCQLCSYSSEEGHTVELEAETIDPEQLETIKRAWETDPALVRSIVFCVQGYGPTEAAEDE